MFGVGFDGQGSGCLLCGFGIVSRAVLEAEAVVSGFEDMAVMGQAIEQRGGHLGIAEDAGPFAEAEVGGDDDAGMLVYRHDLWAKVLAHLKPRSMLEIGVWEGEFAEVALRNAPALNRYFMLDAWRHMSDWNKPLNVGQDRFEQTFATAIRRTDFAADRRVILGRVDKEDSQISS